MKEFAVFDLDGTLYDTHLGVELLREIANIGAMPNMTADEFAVVYKEWQQSPDRTDYYDKYLDVYYNEHLIGVAKHEFDEACRRIAATVLQHTYDEVYDALQAHQRAGYAIIIISKSPKPAVEAVAEQLGADYAWGWEFHFDKGVYTGQYIYEDGSSEKDRIIRRIAQEHDLTFDNSYGYGDSRGDIRILQLVSYPVCINPDRYLHVAAIANNWKVAQVSHVAYDG